MQIVMRNSEDDIWQEESKEIWGLWIRGVLLMGGLAAVAVKICMEALNISVTWPAWCAFGIVVLLRIAVRIRRANR